MDFTVENILLIGSFLLFVSIVAGKTGYRFGVPALLLFLFVGMLFGSDGLGVQFHNANQAQFVGMVALTVILYTGGMDTKFKEIRPVLMPGIMLSTVGVILTTFFTGLFIWWLVSGTGIFSLALSFTVCFLLAAVMSSTDSASVFAILRSQKINLKYNLRPLLELESGSNDPMAYILTILLIQMSQSSELGIMSIASVFFIQLIVGVVGGYLLGKLTIWILNKVNIDNQALYPILLLSFVFFTFSLTQQFGGNGYLAVYIAGIMVGNAPIISNRKVINTFMDGLTWLCQIIMFLALGLLVNPREMLATAPIALLIALFLIFVARPLTIFLCMLPFKKFHWKAKTFISWVGLRGAVPIILATYPLVAKIEGSIIIFNIVFFITILSLLIQGTSISFLAKKLQLSKPFEKEGNEFGVELPDEIDTNLYDMTLTKDMLEDGDTLATLELPPYTLVMMIKRNDEYIIPNGSIHLKEGDKLLLISEKTKQEE